MSKQVIYGSHDPRRARRKEGVLVVDYGKRLQPVVCYGNIQQLEGSQMCFCATKTTA